MKYYWQISSVLMLMSLCTVGWLSYELGLLSDVPLFAADEKAEVKAECGGSSSRTVRAA